MVEFYFKLLLKSAGNRFATICNLYMLLLSMLKDLNI